MKKIFLLSLPLLAFVWAFSPAASFKVSGKVKDEQGNALAGGHIAVKGTSIGTTSSADGSYTIEANSEKDVLVFSYVGYEVKEEKIKGRATIDVVLKVASQHLKEVVVTEDRDVEMKKEIKSQTYPSLNTTLQGKASGTVNGNPGSNATIRLRGISSIQNNNKQFYDKHYRGFQYGRL